MEFGFLKGFAISNTFILIFTFLPLQKLCLDNEQQHPCSIQMGIKMSRCLFAHASQGTGPKTFSSEFVFSQLETSRSVTGSWVPYRAVPPQPLTHSLSLIHI